MRIFPRALVVDAYRLNPCRETINRLSEFTGYSVRQIYRHLNDGGIKLQHDRKRDKNGRFTSK